MVDQVVADHADEERARFRPPEAGHVEFVLAVAFFEFLDDVLDLGARR